VFWFFTQIQKHVLQVVAQNCWTEDFIAMAAITPLFTLSRRDQATFIVWHITKMYYDLHFAKWRDAERASSGLETE